MVRTKEAGQPYDHAALAARVRTAVAEVVRQQIDAGVDVVSDGEQGNQASPIMSKTVSLASSLARVYRRASRATRRSSQTSSRRKAVP